MSHSKQSRALALLMALVMVFSLIPQTVFAAAGSHITVTEPQAIETSTGAQAKIYLDEIFTDTESHALTYTLDNGDYGTQTKLAQDTDGRWMLSFTHPNAGIYTPTVTATCPEGDSASVTLQITVTAGAEGDDLQYGYDETPADSVTVYVTLSSNGIPILASDGTVLSHLKVEVPYFDLANQGLGTYHRYQTQDGRGAYINDTLVQRPTALHLYLYLLGVYYLGLSPEQVTSGSVKILGHEGLGSGVIDLAGNLAYEDSCLALNITGSPTSLYMQQFWGHDENLMYYRNHVYPLMGPGWGSTADYILLSDGDTIDLAMFDNWSFWTKGAFAAFEQDEWTIDAGSTLTFHTVKYDTQPVAEGGSEQFDPITGLNVAVYDEDWNLVSNVEPLTDGENAYSYTFPTEGTYYLMATDANAGQSGAESEACYAPATAMVTVGGTAFDPDTYYADFDFSRITLDEAGTDYVYHISTGTTYVEHFSNPGDKKLYTVTVPSGTKTVYVTYPADFAIDIAEYCALFGDDGTVSWDYYAGSDYDYSVTENADGSHTLALPAAFLMEKGLSIAAEEQDSSYIYEYFNCFKFVAGENTKPGGNDKIAVTGVVISQTELTVDRYETAQLSAHVLPENANNQRLRWISDDSSVATVDSTGLVTAVAEGTATITVSSVDGGFTASCTVTVTDSVKPPQDESGCYEISTAQQLQWFAREVNGGAYTINGKLMNDVDLSSVCSETLGRWTPIGDYADGRRYEGVFDGQGYAVRGLYLIGDSDMDYRNANSYYVALFGLCDGATIRNLSVYGDVMCGYRYMAGIVGRMCQVNTRRAGTIENCHSYVTFHGTPTNDMLYGYAGVVATADSATISGCSNHGDIYGLQGQTGGIVASATSCLIENCWNEGSVHLRGYQSGFQGVGGIVGCALGENVVTNCYNTGDVSFYYRTQAVVHYAGGIVGRVGSQYGTHQLKLSYCYNTGSISGDLADNSFLGGIVGGNSSEKSTTTALQCYYLDTSAAQGGAEDCVALTQAQLHAAAFAGTLGTGYQVSCPYPVLAIQTATPHVDADEDGHCDVCGGSTCLHSDTKVENRKEPTCTEPGYSGDVICTSCGETVAQGYEVAATGHHFTDGKCSSCGAVVPTRKDGVEATATAKVKTGMAYLLSDLQGGKIFQAPEGSTLSYRSYYYQRSTDGGETWGELTGFSEAVFGATTISLTELEEGTYTYRFYASVDGGVTLSEDTWTLTLRFMDEPDFDFTIRVGQDYNGNYPIIRLYRVETDENGQEVLGEELENCFLYSDFTSTLPEGQDSYDPALGQLVNNYQTFYTTLVAGRYAYRAFAQDDEGNYTVELGGMTLDLPTDSNVDGASSGGTDLYLQCVSFYTSSRKTDNTYFTADEYHVRLNCPIMGCDATFGTAYTSGKYAYYPVVLYAAGNACLYNSYGYPDIDGYIFTQNINQTFAASYRHSKKTVNINTALDLTVTVPGDADFGLYFQWNNFNTTEVSPTVDWSDNDDGTKTAVYQVSKGNSNYTWRLSDDSHVTQAGWLSSLSASAEKSFSFEDDAPTDRLSHDRTQLGTAVINRDEADLQVNLDPSGSRVLDGTTRVRVYRHWQLINTDAGNIMVEPDYHWSILSGDATFQTVNGGNTTANWADITPGTEDSILTVSYDALDVNHGSYGSHGGFFPATTPQRIGVIVVPGTDTTVGSGDADVDFAMPDGFTTTRSLDWDYNYDTWYYEAGETAPALTFAVKATGSATVEYAFVSAGNDLKAAVSDWQTASVAEDGSCSVPLAAFRSLGNGLGGTVILRITDETGVSYRLVRVAQVTITAENLTNRGEDIMPGNQVKLSFQGMFRGVNKVSGIFNPTVFQPRYSAGETEYSGTLGQYQRMDNASVTVTIPEDIAFAEGQDSTTFTFTNGYTYGSMYSAANPFAFLYNMTDSGVGTNFNAVTVTYAMNHYADAVVTVHRTVYYDTAISVTAPDGSVLEDYQLTLTDRDGQQLLPDDNGRWQLDYGTYHYTLVKDGYVRTYGSFSLSSADAAALVDGILTLRLTLEPLGENAWDGQSTAQPQQDEEGTYLIGTAAELAWFAAAVNEGQTAISARLTADLQLSGFDWTPIGNSSQKYAGSFDGCGHVICNLYISSSDNYQALFGYLASGASVTQLGVSGNVTTSGNYAGGIAAYMANGSCISQCFSAVSVSAAKWAGGIAGSGQSYQAEITDCYNTGSVTATGTSGFAGGIVSCGSSATLGPKVTNCYNVGSVSGAARLGGVSACTSSNSYGGNCYYLAGCCESSSTLGEAVSAEELRQLAATLGEHFAADDELQNDGFPILSWQVIGHSWGQPEWSWTDFTSATATFTCRNNPAHVTVLEAVISSEDVSSPTCTVDGSRLYTASVSFEEQSYTDVREEILPATGHDTELVGAKDATCTEDGYTGDLVCQTCGETVEYGTAIPATGHDTELVGAKDATCTEDGYTGDLVCQTCGETVEYGTAIPATGHDYDHGFCTVCGEEDPDYIPAPVVSVSVVASSGAIRLSWDAVDSAAKYGVYRSTDGESWSFYTYVTSTSWTNKNVTPGTKYYYRVVSVREDGIRSENSNVVSRTADCAAPVVQSANIATGGIQLSWSAVDGAVKYGVYRSTDGESWSFYTYVTSTSWTNKSVTPGVKYYYRVKAVCANTEGNSAYSNVAWRTADCAAPVVQSANVSTGGIQLSWKAVDGAVKYGVYRSTDGENWSFYTYVTSTSWTNRNVTPGTKYYYRVKAVCENTAGNSAYSNVAWRTADCAAPVVSISTLSSSGAIQLSWKAVDGAVKYGVYRSTDGENWSFYTYVTSTSWTNKSVTPGTKYYYRVKAICENTAGNSAYSNVVSRTADCAAPVLSVQLNDNGKPQLSWEAVDGAVKYYVYRSTDGVNFQVFTTVTGTGWTNSSAAGGTTYYYRVKAVCANTEGNSALSDTVSIQAR